MTNDFKLPLVGLGTCYCEFSKEDPDAGVRRHRGGMRRLLETELAMARCEFDRLKGYYEELDMKSPLYLAGVTNCVVGALGRGDLKLFDRILKDLRRYPRPSLARARKSSRCGSAGSRPSSCRSTCAGF